MRLSRARSLLLGSDAPRGSDSPARGDRRSGQGRLVEARSRVSQILWRVAGVSDQLIHKYHNVDLEQVWEVTQRDLKDLRRAGEQLFAGI